LLIAYEINSYAFHTDSSYCCTIILLSKTGVAGSPCQHLTCYCGDENENYKAYFSKDKRMVKPPKGTFFFSGENNLLLHFSIVGSIDCNFVFKIDGIRISSFAYDSDG
jgi:hypothetical protein